MRSSKARASPCKVAISIRVLQPRSKALFQGERNEPSPLTVSACDRADAERSHAGRWHGSDALQSFGADCVSLCLCACGVSRLPVDLACASVAAYTADVRDQCDLRHLADRLIGHRGSAP